VIGTLIVAFLLVSGYLVLREGFMLEFSKRIGPPLSTPGIMAPIKFFFKEVIKSELTYAWSFIMLLPIIGLIITIFLLMITMPQLYVLAAFH